MKEANDIVFVIINSLCVTAFLFNIYDFQSGYSLEFINWPNAK